MRKILKRFLVWSAILLGLLLVIIFLPMGYVETQCRGQIVSNPKFSDALGNEWQRDEAKTITTFSEWYIVYAYEDYANVLKDGDPHDYKFIPAIYGYWHSLCALSQAAAPHGGMSGESKQLVYTIGGSFTLELLVKAAYEETFGRVFAWIDGDHQSEVEKWSYAQARDYGAFLHQVPWYRWDFADDVKTLAQMPKPSLRDKERGFALGNEFWAKAQYAKAIGAAVAATGFDQLQARSIVTHISEEDLRKIADVDVISSNGNEITIETPRYAKFNEIARMIAKSGGQFINISGNDDIMVSAFVRDDQKRAGEFYRYARQASQDIRILRLIKVSELSNLKDEFEYIYDY